MQKFKVLLSLTTIFYFNNVLAEVVMKAVCITPIADLVGESFKTKDAYLNIPISGEKGQSTCPRVHQAIFNEIVDVLEEKGEEIKVKINSVFYQVPGTKTKESTYWTLKENFITFDELNNLGIDLSNFPKEINFNSTKFESPEKNVVTLKFPFYDKTTNNVYSAGTRFVIKEENDEDFIVFIFDSNNKQVTESILSKNLCHTSQQKSNEEKINNFVILVKQWANLNSEFIPYVFGGCSFQKAIPKTKDNFRLKSNATQTGYYIREDEYPIFSGFDCSGLIARAAQICEIPYFFKNTITAALNLKQLDQNEEIQNGDLIWFPGHIIIISDINNNLYIEARGYSSGFGKVQELEIGKLFKNIHTFQELISNFYQQTPLDLLDKNGNVSQKINEFKILKMNSAWN